jgi:type II secretory pathway component GspD/PulD (secretin)
MPDKKLTDAEIVKAVSDISNAHYIVIAESGNVPVTIGDVFDLNNRLQDKNKAYKYYYDECLKDLKKANAENERLIKVYELSNRAYRELQKRVEPIKAEAYKEFAERLKEKAHSYFLANLLWVVNIEYIDNLLKELVGGTTNIDKQN